MCVSATLICSFFLSFFSFKSVTGFVPPKIVLIVFRVIDPKSFTLMKK